MTTYTAAQIAQIAAGAGFTGTGLVRAIAVALAESSGTAAATHTNSDGSIDRGLWQLNSRWHPEVSAAQALAPATAAAATYTISKAGTDWHEWATWNSGAAAAQMGRAQLAAASVKPGSTAQPALFGIPSPGDIIGGTEDLIGATPDVIGQGINSLLNSTGLSGLAKIAEAVVKGAVWMANPHNWLRVLEVTAGTGVVILGIKMLADSGVGGPVGAAARGATKVGGTAAKAAKTAAKTAAKGAV